VHREIKENLATIKREQAELNALRFQRRPLFPVNCRGFNSRDERIVDRPHLAQSGHPVRIRCQLSAQEATWH
jgi:hypothetical protein